jgi:phage-related protein
MTVRDRPLVWLYGEIKSPPFSVEARVEAGVLLRRVQQGERVGLPHVRPMPVVGRRCYELRLLDAEHTWRIIYRTDVDAVVIAAVFNKTTRTTPSQVIDESRRRLRQYDHVAGASS